MITFDDDVFIRNIQGDDKYEIFIALKFNFLSSTVVQYVYIYKK